MDFYQKITDRMIEMLDGGVAEWQRSWASFGEFPLRANGQRYSGVNVLTLWFARQEHSFTSPYWMTYKQAEAMGAQVRKGSKGEQVVFASTFEKAQDDGSSRRVPFMKTYAVFNADQIDGLPDRYHPAAELAGSNAERIEKADRFFGALDAALQHGGDRAYYSPALDMVQMPLFEAFRDAESYYATLAHEMIHWSGAAHRLNRLDPEAIFGSLNYAEEELVAELGAAFSMAYLGLAAEPREDHAQYLQAWLAKLKGDRKFIVKAAAAAERAMQFLINKAGEQAAEDHAFEHGGGVELEVAS